MTFNLILVFMFFIIGNFCISWGEPTNGVLGQGNGNFYGGTAAISSEGFINFSTSFPVISVSAGGSHTCAVFSNAQTRCWGSNSNGQLGQGNSNNVGLNSNDIPSLQPMNIVLLSPSSGSVLGGETISVVNGVVGQTLTFSFSTCSTNIIVPTSNKISTPSWACGPGPVSISGINVPVNTTFTFYASNFAVLSVFPSSLYASTPIWVTVTGINFVATTDITCIFGSFASNGYAHFVSSTTILCLSPLGATASSNSTLEIALNGLNSTSNGLLVYFYSYCSSIFLAPYTANYGPMSGGTVFSIFFDASAFSTLLNSPAFVFNLDPSDTITVQGQFLANSSSPSGFAVLGTSPPIESLRLLSNINITFYFSLNAGAILELSFPLIFEYYPDPSIFSLFPNIVPFDTSFSLTLVGYNFATFTSIQRLRISASGGIQYYYNALQYTSSANIFFVSQPIGVPGISSAEVTFNIQQYTSDNFTINSYVINAISPTFGPATGSTTITLSGVNIIAAGSLMCVFGSFQAPSASYLTSTLLRCTTPAQSGPMTVRVKVSVDGTLFTYAQGTFLYYNSSVLSKVRPSGLPTLASSNSTINITGLFPSLPASSLTFSRCKFASSYTPVSTITTSLISCLVPGGLTGAIPVTVAFDGTNDEISSLFINFFSISSLSPSFGPTAGGTVVLLLGLGFDVAISSWTCRYSGAVLVSAVALSAGQLSCASPPQSLGGGNSTGALATLGVSLAPAIH